MGRVMSGWEARESTRMEREMDLGSGFVRRVVVIRWIAVGRWFDRQRRGRRRLIFVSSSWVRLAMDEVASSLEEDEDSRAAEGWKTTKIEDFEGQARE